MTDRRPRRRLPPGTRRIYARLVAPRLADEYLPLLPPPRGRVLDVGCGPGELLGRLARRHPDIGFVGVDLDPLQVRLARRRAPGVDVLAAQGRRLPFPEGSFDLVFATESLHHWRRPRATLDEAHRVLRPGGMIVVLEGRGTRSWGAVRRSLRLPLPGPLLRPLYRAEGYDDESVESVRAAFAASRFRGCAVEALGDWWRVQGRR